MKIELKANNRPTKPGWYILKRNAPSDTFERTVFVSIGQDNLLRGQSPLGSFPLSIIEDSARWSDAIEIESV